MIGQIVQSGSSSEGDLKIAAVKGDLKVAAVDVPFFSWYSSISGSPLYFETGTTANLSKFITILFNREKVALT